MIPSMDDAVKVLVVSPATPVWGAQLYLLDQLDALASRGVELTLATPADSEFGTAWAERGFPLIDVDLPNRVGLRKPGTDQRSSPLVVARDLAGIVKTAWWLPRLARRFDVMHSYAMRTHLEVAIAGRLARRPVALDLVNIVRPGLGRRVLDLAGRLASLTVANSAATRAILSPSVVSTIVHPGIDLDRFSPEPDEAELRAELGGSPDVPLVAIIGRLDVRKGVQILVDALDQAEGAARTARLIVVGDAGTGPTEFSEALKADATGRLGDRVSFLGRRSDIPAIIRAVDVVVNASKAEPFGLTMLEAQACGTPVIGTDAGGIPEFVIDGETGLLVPPFDAAALSEALDRLLGDPGLGAKLATEAEHRARPARGLEAQYDELAGIYRGLAGVGEAAW